MLLTVIACSPVATEDIPDNKTAFDKTSDQGYLTGISATTDSMISAYDHVIFKYVNLPKKKTNLARIFWTDTSSKTYLVACILHYSHCLTVFLSFFFIEDSEQVSFLMQKLNS